MPTATPATVRKQIAAGDTDPVYVLQGEDDVEKAALAREFEELVEEGLRAFNVERIQGGEMTTGDRLSAGVSFLVAAARTMPMMAPRRVVLVLRAEMLLAPRRESEAASRALEALELFLQRPEPQTTLVFVAASLDKRSRIYRLLAKQATLVECGVIVDQADAERWIRNQVAAAGVSIDPAAARLLAARAGPDVKRLRNDVDRLLLYALGQKTISVEDARQMAGPAALQDDWQMTNAIEAGDGAGALRQLALLLDSGAPPEKILGQLGWLARTKITSPVRLRGAIDILFRTDLDLKRSAGDPRILLERLVVELCSGPVARPAGGGGFRR
jgi:DNA polymerase-3 subunit delta